MKGILYFPLNTICSDHSYSEIYFNRAFLYGDGFFESMRWHKGKISFFDDHCLRIRKSFEILKLNGDFNENTLYEQITTAVKEQEVNGDARVRLTFFRVADGYYTPEKSTTGMLMQIQPWPDNEYAFNSKGISMGIFHDHYKTTTSLSNIKTLNSLVYVMAGIYTRENNIDDAVILNDKGRVSEATSSNLFMLKDDVLFTPPASEGCVEGVMRKQAFRFAKNIGITLIEKPISIEVISHADEIFISNGIRGFIPVTNYLDKQFTQDVAGRMHAELNNI
jgi:aminodeoxychorismate lyase